MSDRLLKESDVLMIAFQLPLVVNSAFADAVKAFPSADRPQGEWVLISEVASNLGHKCSNCGEKAKKIVARSVLVDNYYCNKAEPITEYTHKEQLSKFCPNCGCRMKGADDEAD